VETLFVSDLHLDADRPAAIRACTELIRGRARQADALYILGDLFEYWVGDDDPAEAFQDLFDALRSLTDTGVRVFLMHGNRDFLIGRGLTERTGARLLADPVVADLYGRPALLMHGDTLCTDDVDYQAFRRMVRDPAWQTDFLSHPLPQRLRTVCDLRERSREAMAGKREEIMDVNDEAVRAAFRTHDVDLLIHGHTHRPGIHELDIDGRACDRVVLGDWYREQSLLSVNPGGLELEDPRVGPIQRIWPARGVSESP
jgi:UDP-2,3-diacylglucosamine hydrolase